MQHAYYERFDLILENSIMTFCSYLRSNTELCLEIDYGTSS